MNILYLIHRYPPARGGSERFIQEVARRSVQERNQATVYTSDVLNMEGFLRPGYPRLPVGRQDDAGVQVWRFSAKALPQHNLISWGLGQVPWDPIGMTMAPPGLVLPDLWSAVRRTTGFDLVHASAYPNLMYLGAVAARRSRARLVLMPCLHVGPGEQGRQRRHFLGRRMMALYHQAEAIIALTDWERRMLSQAGVPAERIHVTGVGVNPEEARGADGARFRRAFGLPAERPLVSFIGRKSPGKGALHLLEAARRLLTEGRKATFALVGESTPEFAQGHEALPGHVQAHVLDLSLSEEDKQDLLAASSLLALPSQDDAFGIVLLEAWLHGKPVIGARAGGIPEVVEDQVTGLLNPFGDISALAQAIAWLLDHPAEAAEMGKKGRQTTLNHWTWQKAYERVRTVY